MKEDIQIRCPKCNSTNIFGMYLDEWYGEFYWTWECANSYTSLEPSMYKRLACEDCKYEWEGWEDEMD